MFLGSALLSLLVPQPAQACSRILWENSLGTYVGLGEDWIVDARTKLDFTPGASVRKLVTAGNDLALDVTDQFTPAPMFTFIRGTETTLGGGRDS